MTLVHFWVTYYFDRDFLRSHSHRCNKHIGSLVDILNLLSRDTIIQNLKDRVNTAKLLLLRWCHFKYQSSQPNFNDQTLPPSKNHPPSRSVHQPSESAFSTIALTQPHPLDDAIPSISLFEFAGHMARVELRLFQKIQQTELLWLNWRRPDVGRKRCRHVHRLIERANEVSRWVANKIVSGETFEKRCDIIQRFIRLASRCVALNNLNSVMEILGGLNLHVVQRLKETWRLLPDSFVQRLSELENLMDSRANYKNYREALRTCRFPAVPYLGVYLRDLTFVEEGNKTYLDSDELVINFEKLRLISSILSEFRQFQEPHNTYELSFAPPSSPRERSFFRKGFGLVVPQETLEEMSYVAEPIPTTRRLQPSGSGPLIGGPPVDSLQPSSSCPDI